MFGRRFTRKDVEGQEPARSKFNATRVTIDGINFDSKKEAEYYGKLKLRIAAGEVKYWTRQRLLKLEVNGHPICGYRMDFVLTLVDGTIQLVEIKGMALPDWKIKWRLLEALKDTAEFRACNGFLIGDRIELVLESSKANLRWMNREKKPPKPRKAKKK